MTERFRIVSALGIIQILTWGSTFYLLAVLATPIASETGWGTESIAAGVSVGLLVAGLAAPFVGRLIAARGGRVVMAGGVGILICGLLGLATVSSLPAYLLAWAVMGVGMSATLYDAAFSTLGTIFGSGARAAITQLTLWGGFASTVCWPLSAFMVESVGWRGACLGYAALHVCVTLPLCLWGLPRAAKADGPGTKRVKKVGPDLRVWLLVLIAVCLTMISSVLSIHLIPILTASGLSLAAAVALGALIGPAQVGARVLEMLGRERHPAIVTLLVSCAMVLVGLIALRLNVSVAAGIIAFGAGNGLYSIARGAVPLAAFGTETYPQVMAFIARPSMIAAAIAPIVGALLIGRVGPEATLSALTGCAAIALAASLFLRTQLTRNP